MVTYNGKDLEDFQVICLGRGTFNAPARDIEQVHIPGKSGDLLFDNGGFKNVNLTYPDCHILTDFDNNIAALRNFLLSSPGYHRLEDSYNPDEYRMAEFRGPLDAEAHTARGNDSGKFSLTFNCMPQRWLKEGEEEIELAATQVLYNKWQPAKPIWTVRLPAGGSVTITIVKYPYPGTGSSLQTTITNSGTTVRRYRIDTETGTVYEYADYEWSGSGYNGAAAVSGDMPIIGGFSGYEVRVAGLTGGASCKIIPRWWRA